MGGGAAARDRRRTQAAAEHLWDLWAGLRIYCLKSGSHGSFKCLQERLLFVNTNPSIFGGGGNSFQWPILNTCKDKLGPWRGGEVQGWRSCCCPLGWVGTDDFRLKTTKQASAAPWQQHSHKPLARFGDLDYLNPGFRFKVRHFQKHGNKMQSFPKSSKLGLFLFFLSDQDVTNLAFWQTPRYVICPVSSMTVRAVAGGDGFSGYSEHPSVQVFCIWENEGNRWGFIIPFYYDLTNATRKKQNQRSEVRSRLVSVR